MHDIFKISANITDFAALILQLFYRSAVFIQIFKLLKYAFSYWCIYYSLYIHRDYLVFFCTTSGP